MGPLGYDGPKLFGEWQLTKRIISETPLGRLLAVLSKSSAFREWSNERKHFDWCVLKGSRQLCLLLLCKSLDMIFLSNLA